MVTYMLLTHLKQVMGYLCILADVVAISVLVWSLTPLHRRGITRHLQKAPPANAAEKARQTFLSLLTPEQRTQYEGDRTITVQGNLPHGKLYTIRCGPEMHAYNVHDGAMRYCTTPADQGVYAPYDLYISQMLLIRSNEAEFLRIANRNLILPNHTTATI